MTPDRPPLFEPGRTVEVDPRDAVVVVHRFLERCRDWGRDKELPDRIERVRANPTPEEAARLHAWAAWVAFTEHALREVERGDLDHWFENADAL